MAGPVFESSDSRAKTMLLFAGGILATVALVAGLVVLWPDADGDVVAEGTTTTFRGAEAERTTTTVPGAVGEPSERTTTTALPGPVDLFTDGASEALSELARAAGDPAQAMEVAVYGEYAFLAYRDPEQPAHIDRRVWRLGEVGEAEANPIDDRVDADTEAALWPLSELDLGVLPRLTADAATRFDLEVAVTHVIIDRFLPFDRRVLIRVYASPTDGRSGGGYVQYTIGGTFVKVVA